MFEKMTDGDVMVYLMNTVLQISRVAQERKVDINAHFKEDGFIYVTVGGYDVCRINEGSYFRCGYKPKMEDTYNLNPQQIRFGQEPKEEA